MNISAQGNSLQGNFPPWGLEGNFLASPPPKWKFQCREISLQGHFPPRGLDRKFHIAGEPCKETSCQPPLCMEISVQGRVRSGGVRQGKLDEFGKEDKIRQVKLGKLGKVR